MNKLQGYLLVLTIVILSCTPAEKVDLIVHNAKIYTLNETFDVTQAMAIRNGIIIDIGPEHEIKNKYPAQKYLDAKTRPVYPNFITYSTGGSITDTLINPTTEQLLAVAQSYYQKGLQVNTTCKEDTTLASLLNIYAETLKTTNDKRWKIGIHQKISAKNIQKLGQYNIITNIHPNQQNPINYQEILAQNGMLTLNVQNNPIQTFYEVVSEQNGLTPKQALKAITIWAALANFEEDKKGSLEIGKNADFMVLSNDLIEARKEDLLNVEVLHHYINGKEIIVE